jgi:HSP20 family molecular chaperone IbpA
MAVKRPPDWPASVEGPLSELEKIRAELDTLFRRFAPVYDRSLSDSFAAVSVSEDADAFLIQMDMSGFEEHEIEVSATEKTLTVSVSREVRRVDVDATHSTQSAEKNMAESTVRFPVDVDPEGMEAKCAGGKLTVRMPKVRSSGPKKITIKPEG